jgi:pSer/pThr/pTyr-binding forkhead associated (FHA) protein
VGERFYLERPEITIGRDPESDIFLNDVTVSRKHARLLVAEGVVTIEDAGSLNGTYINDLRVDTAVLGSGDAVQIGRFRMVFLPGGEGA